MKFYLISKLIIFLHQQHSLNMAQMIFKTIIFIALFYPCFLWCYQSSFYEIDQILQVDWSPDGKYIVTASKSKRVTVFSVGSSMVIWFDTLSSQVTTAKFSKTGKWLGVGQMGTDTIIIYNVPSFTLNTTFSAEHSSSNTNIFELDFNSDDTNLITCGSDGYVNQRNLVNSTVDWKGLIVSGQDVLTCKYSTTNRVGCFCNDDMYLLKTDGTIDKQKSESIIRDVDFRPGGHNYLYGGCTCDSKLKQYDTAADSLTDYFDTQDDLYAVSYAPDSSFLVTAGKRGHVFIYNTTNVATPQMQYYFKRSRADINSVRVSDDSNYVAVSREDGVIDLYARYCGQCPFGLYKNATICRMCALDIGNCASCKNSTLCYFCFSGYYLNPTNNSQCLICRNAVVGCLQCKSNTVCLVCTQGYYLTGNNCTTCASLTPQCEQCYNNGTCIKCSYTTYLTNTKTCSLCSSTIQNCQACYLQYNATSVTNSTLYCRHCVRGYYASQVQCLACSSNCTMCTNAGVCIACAEQYKLVGSNCVQCNQYCEACNQSGTCYQCIPTTFLQTGSCIKCTLPCLTCSSSSTCLTCPLGYYLFSGTCKKCVNCPLCNPITGACLSCPRGKYLLSGSCANCLNITSHCAICNTTACIMCERNFYLTGANTCAISSSINNCQIYKKNSTSECEHCKFGFYLDTANNTCLNCMISCSICDNPNSCLQCQIGYYLIAANLTCVKCNDPCKTCKSSTECLSCGQQYYIFGTQCLKCWDKIPYCNSCINSTHCLNCYVGYSLAINYLSCTPCPSPCTTCNSSGCLSCQLGYFSQINSCTPCSTGCSACTSLTTCNQCFSTFKLDGNVCILCQNLFSNCQTCSSTACTLCKPYFTLLSGACISCSQNISNCLTCNNGQCQVCTVGYYPASDYLSCMSCAVSMPNCQKCVNGTICDECSSGFYAVANICQKCTNGCGLCSNSNTCDICDTGFILGSGNVCIKCDQQVFGCKMCTQLNGCYQCSIQYYLASPSSCFLCRSAMDGCISCSSNSVCISCDSGYFLNSSSKCQQCNIFGCQRCNQTTAACITCMSNFYLTSTFTCSLCSSLFDNCVVCNITHCLRCDSGTYLSPLGSCINCSSLFQACIFCNSTDCYQCQAGYYVQATNSSCQICNVVGCQLCSSNGINCLSCQNTYYLVNSQCQHCQTMDFGCLSCTGLNSCILCKSGYFLHLNGTCILCSSSYNACQICTNSKCEECKTNYFNNLSSLTKDCVLCSKLLIGCQLCLDMNQCSICQQGYYIQNNQCISCTVLSQCLACSDGNTCTFCRSGYYLKNGQCLLCRDAILGCFSCISSTACLTCGQSFIISDDGTCSMMKGLSPKNYTNVKFKSFYVNDTHLKHTLLTTGIQFVKVEQDWNATTEIELITPPNNKIKLTILKVEWGKKMPLISLDFYTNNPLLQFSNNNNMPFYHFPKKRILFSFQELNIGINFQMKKAVIDQILPQLDTNGYDLVIQYMLNQPQFYRSIVENQRNYYYLFGIAVTIFLLFAYFIKIIFLSPITSDAGDIIPHILLNKVCAMIIYPTLGGYINYCYGFTYIDFPWLNKYFSQAFSNLADESPNSYKMFYNNLNISSTYFLGLISFIVIYTPLYLWTIIKSRNKNNKITGMNKRNNKRSQIAYENYQKGINRVELMTEYIYNIFSAGLVFASSISILGMFLNPSQLLSLSGSFYILGIFVFTMMLVNAIKAFLGDRIKFNRLRVIIKACIMSMMFKSPVILFASLTIIEIGMISIEYKYKIKQWVIPKAWIACQLLNIISYASLIFLSNMILGLLISAVCIIVVLSIDTYLIYSQCQQFDKIRKLRNFRLQSSRINFTIQNFQPDKNQQEIKNSQNFYLEQDQPKKQKQIQKDIDIRDHQKQSDQSQNSLIKSLQSSSYRYILKSKKNNSTTANKNKRMKRYQEINKRVNGI